MVIWCVFVFYMCRARLRNSASRPDASPTSTACKRATPSAGNVIVDDEDDDDDDDDDDVDDEDEAAVVAVTVANRSEAHTVARYASSMPNTASSAERHARHSEAL